jgi:Tfp pilus assembly protein PilW
VVEVLMGAMLASISLVAVAQFFSMQAHQELGHSYRVEMQQALRTSLDSMTRDLRLAGACLPGNGDFVALDGTDGPGADSVTVRSGVVRSDLSCIVTALTALTNTNGTTLTVTSASGFTPNMLVYLRHPGGAGQFTFVASGAGTTVTIADPATIDYPVGSGLFAVDERTYAIDATPPNPHLMLTVNRAAPEAFAVGMTDLQLKYVLQRNCPPCDVVDLPPDDATWALVNEVQVTATARTVDAKRPEDQVTLSETSEAKPRNLLP